MSSPLNDLINLIDKAEDAIAPPPGPLTQGLKALRAEAAPKEQSHSPLLSTAPPPPPGPLTQGLKALRAEAVLLDQSHSPPSSPLLSTDPPNRSAPSSPLLFTQPGEDEGSFLFTTELRTLQPPGLPKRSSSTTLAAMNLKWLKLELHQIRLHLSFVFLLLVPPLLLLLLLLGQPSSSLNHHHATLQFTNDFALLCKTAFSS